ncbi:MAG: hypothetical protein ACRYG8_27165 [Janthinobacterium lividum]
MPDTERQHGYPTRPLAIRIEMNRGAGWEIRQHGEIDQDRTEVVAMIEATIDAYCAQYPHRALVDGVVVAEARP